MTKTALKLLVANEYLSAYQEGKMQCLSPHRHLQSLASSTVGILLSLTGRMSGEQDVQFHLGALPLELLSQWGWNSCFMIFAHDHKVECIV